MAARDDPPAKRRRLLDEVGAASRGGSGGAGAGAAEGDAEDLVEAVARDEVTEATLRMKLEAHIEQSDQDHGAARLRVTASVAAGAAGAAAVPLCRPGVRADAASRRAAAPALEYAMAAGRAADGGTRCAVQRGALLCIQLACDLTRRRLHSNVVMAPLSSRHAFGPVIRGAAGAFRMMI